MSELKHKQVSRDHRLTWTLQQHPIIILTIFGTARPLLRNGISYLVDSMNPEICRHVQQTDIPEEEHGTTRT